MRGGTSQGDGSTDSSGMSHGVGSFDSSASPRVSGDGSELRCVKGTV